ncbi:MAG: MopE-related protein, partial [Deltaproteobacteria bacterium]
GDPCNGIDENCVGVVTDEAANGCGACGAVPREVCDGIDNNCNGLVDEEPEAMCGTCVVQPEGCDNIDNDCDGMIDEGLTRVCGSSVGACRTGMQTCAAGVWGMCSGVGPGMETCDNVDNDCDGVVDGFAQECGATRVGICRPGVTRCVSGAFLACAGGINPGTEICDGLDNNCNAATDENNAGGGAPCTTDCGPGTVTCVDGALACVSSAGEGIAEICDGVDNNCNGRIDEDIPSQGHCNLATLCAPGGDLLCRNGSFQCIGGTPREIEVCDCRDNDCNGVVDNGADATCGAGGRCLGTGYCQCARPCDTAAEFPCAAGYRCETTGPAVGFCVSDPCFNVNCPRAASGDVRECDPHSGECVPACNVRACVAGEVCNPHTGLCQRNNCINFPELCTGDQFCVNGLCVTDACRTVTCPDGQFCRMGACVESCAGVTCVANEACRNGTCVPDPCVRATPCSTHEVCDPTTGACVPDRCQNVSCGPNSECNHVTGACEASPCLGIHCAAGQMCQAGNCVGTAVLDAGVRPSPERVIATGGSCRTGPPGLPSHDGRTLAWLMLALAAVIARRRTR